MIFLGGFNSEMTGTKAVFLQRWAEQRGTPFLRFDYRGHGASEGAFEDGCIGDWAEDAAAVLEQLTQGPQVLVGSSMGGWIALLLARRFPQRVAGLVGIAAAPDFTERRWQGFSDAQRQEILRAGRIELPSAYSAEPYVYTRRLFEDGRENSVLTAPLVLDSPVRLLHGTADPDVPWEVSSDLLAHVTCPDARLTLIRDGDHRLSKPQDLALLADTLDAMLAAQPQGAVCRTL